MDYVAFGLTIVVIIAILGLIVNRLFGGRSASQDDEEDRYRGA